MEEAVLNLGGGHSVLLRNYQDLKGNDVGVVFGGEDVCLVQGEYDGIYYISAETFISQFGSGEKVWTRTEQIIEWCHQNFEIKGQIFHVFSRATVMEILARFLEFVGIGE